MSKEIIIEKIGALLVLLEKLSKFSEKYKKTDDLMMKEALLYTGFKKIIFP